MGPTISLPKTDISNYSITDISHKKPSKSTKKETLFILDWDDTLMCTSFISLKSSALSEEEKNIVGILGITVSKFLEECSKYGNIIIMTNSSQEWMIKTAKNYLKLNPKIFENIKVISTRDKYLKKGIEKKRWKEIALEELISKFGHKIENLICATDSKNDIEVFSNISKGNHEINISTIKFKSKPSPLIMIKEIEYLKKSLYKIIGTNKHYSLIKEKNKNDDFYLSFGSLLDYIFPN